MTDQEFGRPFNLTTAEGSRFHGVEFPSGHVVLANEGGLVTAYMSLAVMLNFPDMADATIERPAAGEG
jgi:hypothetical protein